MRRSPCAWLPDDLVEFLVEMIEDQPARSSRAEVAAPALERERRRQAAQRDVDILKHSDKDDDLAGLADFAARRFPPLD